MPQTVQMDQAALERMIEAKLRTAHDSRSQPNGAQNAQNAMNLRPGESGPQGDAWRGSANPMFTPTSRMTPEQASNVMKFFRGVNQGDFAAQRDALSALNDGTPMARLQQVGTTQDGGVTVPYQFLTEVTIALPKVTPFADKNIIRIIPMASETTRWTKVVQKPAMPPIVPEGSTYGTTGVSFGLIELVARKIGEIVPLTEEILESNQIEMVSVIAELIAEQLGYKRNVLITNGNGASEPEGVMTNSNVATFTWVPTTSLTESDSVIGMFHSLKSQYRGDAIWMFNDQTIKQIRQMKDQYGRYIWTDGFGPNPPTIMGRPVYENPDLTVSQGLFGNFRRGYVVGERDGLLVERNSSGPDWKADIVNFKFRQRYDGKVNDEQAFVKCTNIS